MRLRVHETGENVHLRGGISDHIVGSVCAFDGRLHRLIFGSFNATCCRIFRGYSVHCFTLLHWLSVMHSKTGLDKTNVLDKIAVWLNMCIHDLFRKQWKLCSTNSRYIRWSNTSLTNKSSSLISTIMNGCLVRPGSWHTQLFSQCLISIVCRYNQS